MAHGDIADIKGGRFPKCECSHCTGARAFLEFRDSIPPARPVAIADQASAAAFLLWLAAQLCEIVDIARGDIEVEEED